jgi:2'-5' RNA ligase
MVSSEVRSVPWESAVVVRVPALDELIAGLRRRFSLPPKQNGIPPHVTAIVPFLAAGDLGEDGALPALRTLCAGCAPFDVTFARTARFPRVLYLEPEPAEPFIALARSLMTRWPQLAPYAGGHRRMVPHLTVTTSRPPRVFDQVAEALDSTLPIVTRVATAQLYNFDGRRWSELASLPFAGA